MGAIVRLMASEKNDTQIGVVSSPALDTRSPAKENAWIKFMTYLKWYPKNMASEEKSLILKLDLSILIFGCLSFFTKYLDQQSLTNAYVRCGYSTN